MKQAFLCLTVATILVGTCIAEDDSLLGTWKFVGTKWVSADGTPGEWLVADLGGRSLKLFTATHFAVVTHAADGTFGNAHAGPYTIEGNTFVEMLENSSTDWVGRAVPHSFKVEKDVLRNFWGSPGDGTQAEETWRRVSKIQEGHPLVGAWELVETTWIEADGSTMKWIVAESGGRSLKLFTGTHFAIVTHGRDGSFALANAGRYDLSISAWVEKIENSSDAELLGSESIHSFKIEKDLLEVSYVHPRTKEKTEETWRRVKPRAGS
jgi:hypothetical protein